MTETQPTGTTQPGVARPGQGSLRASDAERDAAAAALAGHFRDGRLDQSELDERLGIALSARTGGELGELLADLPDAAPPAGTASRGGARKPSRRTIPLPLMPVIALIVTWTVIAAVSAAHGGRPFWFPWWLLIVAVVVARHRRLGRGVTGGRR
ncbi:MAG: DUF1707 SHOCT-like domain-containing protein [Streptosporangiaceae bacterium]